MQKESQAEQFDSNVIYPQLMCYQEDIDNDKKTHFGKDKDKHEMDKIDELTVIFGKTSCLISQCLFS